MDDKFKIVTLCGNTKFKKQFFEAQKELTLKGNIVISVGLFGQSEDNDALMIKTREMLDKMDRQKIDLADEVYVINVGGFIDPATEKEIEYAEKKGKRVRYLESCAPSSSNPALKKAGEWDLADVVRSIRNSNEHCQEISWETAIKLHDIIESGEYKKRYQNQTVFAEALGISRPLLSQYNHAVGFMRSNQLDLTALSIYKVYLISILGDKYRDFLDYLATEKIDPAQVATTEFKKTFKKYREDNI